MIDFLQNKKFNIIDNYLSNEISDMLTNLFLSAEFPWYFCPSTFGHDVNFSKEHYESPQFVHTFVKQGKNYSNFTDTIAFLTKINTQSIERLKLNYLTNSNQSGISHPPHLDNEENAHNLINGIIFINESDGDTVIFEGKNVTKIKPKKGRAIFMEGNVLHASNSPVEYKNRLVLNINILKQ